MNLGRFARAARALNFRSGVIIPVAFMLALIMVFSSVGYAQAADPAPENPVLQQYENGKVIVSIGAPQRQYGYRIGDRMKLTFVISAAPGVEVNTEAIARKILHPDGSDFEFVSDPVITHQEKNGRSITTIQLELRSWVPKQSLAFNAAFFYSTEKLPNGKPAWKPAVSPDFIVTTSNTATEASKDLQFGDMEQKPSPAPALTTPLTVLGSLLLAVLPAWLLLLLYRRLFPARVLEPNELAWLTFNGVLANTTSGSGLSYAQTQQVASALRAYLQVESIPVSEVRAPLEQTFSQHPKRHEMVRVAEEALRSIDGALYEKPKDGDETRQALTDSESVELFRKVERLVPRP